MEREPAAEATAAAGARLRTLLAGSAPYRGQWQGYVRRDSRQDVHQGAVAQVLAQYLWDTGEASEQDTDLPRRLKDRVGRALTGQLLAPATLRLFIEAFDMTRADAGELWSLLMPPDTDDGRRVPGTLAVGEAVLPPPQAHEGLSVHELYRVGPGGSPVEHRTVQVIRALEPMETMLHLVPAADAVVEVLRGGRAGPVRRSPFPGMFGVEIVLDRPLRTGETASLEHRTSVPDHEDRSQVRRVVLQPLRNLEMNLRFDPARLPSSVWWVHWTSVHAAEPTVVEEVDLSPAHDVHRFLPAADGAVGFRWRW